jgi:hypothetical protein
MSIIASIVLTIAAIFSWLTIAGTVLSSWPQISRAIDARHGTGKKMRVVHIGPVRHLRSPAPPSAKIIEFPGYAPPRVYRSAPVESALAA